MWCWFIILYLLFALGYAWFGDLYGKEKTLPRVVDLIMYPTILIGILIAFLFSKIAKPLPDSDG